LASPIRFSIKNLFVRKNHNELAKSIKNIFGFYPENVFLYSLAFRHKSVAPEVQEGVKNSNERLEFLGDAILSAVVADYLFKIFPYKDEGFLTKMRSKMVSRAQLNQLALKLGISDLIQATKERGSQPKSLNGDAFEALIGAIYLDKGYDFTKKIIIERIYKILVDIDELEKTETNYKSRLIEWSQKEKKSLEFRHANDGNTMGNFHNIELYFDGELISKAKDFSIKAAEQNAAEKAYNILKNRLQADHDKSIS
jgi:ribonuclease-3